MLAPDRLWLIGGIAFGAIWPALYFGLHRLARHQDWYLSATRRGQNAVCNWLAISLTLNIALLWLAYPALRGS